MTLRTPTRSGHILSRSHVTVTVSSEVSVFSAEFQTLHCAAFHVRFKRMILRGLPCSNSCLQRQVSSASFPRRLARTCTSALHVSSVPNLACMPTPSQIGCRHGSRESLHVPGFSRDVSSPSFQKFQLSGRIILVRQNSSLLTAVFSTKQKQSSPLHNLHFAFGTPFRYLAMRASRSCRHCLWDM